MAVRITGWPVARMRFSGSISDRQFQRWLQALDAMLARAEPFAVVVQVLPGIALPADYRRQETVWYKARRAQLAVSCRGMVRIVADAAQVAAMTTPQMRRAYPCPIHACTDTQEALDWAAACLRSASVAASA